MFVNKNTHISYIHNVHRFLHTFTVYVHCIVNRHPIHVYITILCILFVCTHFVDIYSLLFLFSVSFFNPSASVLFCLLTHSLVPGDLLSLFLENQHQCLPTPLDGVSPAFLAFGFFSPHLP